MKKNLVLAGFMGTGKSTIGDLTARKNGAAFVDTDAEVEARAGKTINQIFEEDGEAAFRKMEAEICQAATQQTGCVIATGGGALTNPETKEMFIAQCVVVNLQVSLTEVEKRMVNDNKRPLIKQREAMKALYASRMALYQSLPHQIEADGKTPLNIAEELSELWNLYG